MKRMSLRGSTWALAALVVLAVVVGGCEFPGAGRGGGFGSVRITIGAGAVGSMRTIVPGNATIARYEIYGADLFGRTVRATLTGETTTEIQGLAAGTWRFDVDAVNAGGVPLYTDTDPSVLVQSGLTSDVDLELGLISGTGTIVLAFEWTDGAVIAPNVTAVLTPYVGAVPGTPIGLVHADFDLTSVLGVTRYEYTAPIVAGYYLLTASVLDGTEELFAPTDTLRIFTGLTTTAEFSLEGSGSVDMEITVDLQDPLDVTVTADPAGAVTAGSPVTFTAVVVGASVGATYQWYLDGTPLSGATGLTLELNTGGVPLDPGRYQVALVAFDDPVLGSDSVVLEVLP